MSDFIKHLWSFNRKERFFLVGTALGNPDFLLGTEFRQRLGLRFDLKVPLNAFVAMDYHLDWIYASVYLSREGDNASNKYPNPCKLVSGNQEDMDLIVAFDSGETTHLIMLEAKAETAWSNDQMKSKAKRLKAIFGEKGDRFPHLCPHFGLMSPRPPRQLKTDCWPSWMLSPTRAQYCMKLTVPSGRKKLTRCNDSRRPDKNGAHFKVESTDKK